MNKLIIFCEGYGQQIENTLQLTNKNVGKRPITIIVSGYSDVFSCLQEINEKKYSGQVELIFLQPLRLNPKSGMINRMRYLIPDIVKEKNYLKSVWRQYFSELADCDVYFHSRGYNGTKHFLLKKLSVKNKIFYIPPSFPPYMEHYLPSTLNEFGKLLLFKSVYGFDIALGQFYSTRGFPWMTDGFLQRIVTHEIGPDERDSLMSDFSFDDFKVFDTGKYKVIYFDDNTIGAGYLIDVETYRKEITDILEVVLKHYPEKQIGRKYHPGYEGDGNLVKYGEIIPSYIPAELLYDAKTELYISIFSRSIANLTEGTPVSVADLISFRDRKEKEAFREDTIRVSKKTILFPGTLQELDNILIDLKRKRSE